MAAPGQCRRRPQGNARLRPWPQAFRRCGHTGDREVGLHGCGGRLRLDAVAPVAGQDARQVSTATPPARAEDHAGGWCCTNSTRDDAGMTIARLRWRDNGGPGPAAESLPETAESRDQTRFARISGRRPRRGATRDQHRAEGRSAVPQGNHRPLTHATMYRAVRCWTGHSPARGAIRRCACRCRRRRDPQPPLERSDRQ